MLLKLLDYSGKAVEFDIGELSDIAVITIEVITGDEIAKVVYKDYTTEEFDSGTNRLADYYDESYEIYRYDSEKNLIDDPKFKERRRSYWRWYSDDDDDEDES